MIPKIFHDVLDKARELLQTQVDLSGFCNCPGSGQLQAEVYRENARAAADRYIVELKLEQVF